MGKRMLAVMFLLFAVVSRSYGDEKHVTPYGDYCKACITYGTCKHELPRPAALEALGQYYGEKGYEVGPVNHKGRFIEAEIYKDGTRVDKVLFDRKTGRLRSID